MGLLLHLETSTRMCSVALAKDGAVVAFKEQVDLSYSHAEQLTLFIEETLKTAAVAYQDLDGIVVSKGPGSYTGLRIGVSTAKGLCYALDIPLMAIDSLTVLAHHPDLPQTGETHLRCPMIDARRMEVYAAVFDGVGTQVRAIGADIITADSYSEYLDRQPVYFYGDGAQKCQEVLGAHPNAKFPNLNSTSARGMAELGESLWQQQQFEDVAYFEPFYLKDFVAVKPKKMF